MSVGDGIALAGCAWSTAYVLRWSIECLRRTKLARTFAESVDKLVAAIKQI